MSGTALADRSKQWEKILRFCSLPRVIGVVVVVVQGASASPLPAGVPSEWLLMMR